MFLIRRCRLKNVEIWELRLDSEGVFCYFSLFFNEKDKCLDINIHSNVDLQNHPKIDYEEIITNIECLYENMFLEIDHKFLLHFHSVNTENIELKDEELYGNKTQQEYNYINKILYNECQKLIEQKLKLSLNKIIS